MSITDPLYLKLSAEIIKERAKVLEERLKECTICPHHCKVNRWENERGICSAGNELVVASFGPHYGEEDYLVGSSGSGTIFFSHCALRCVFCQNYDISCFGEGYEISVEKLASIMIVLQERKCHNINLVTPTHFVPHIVKAVSLAVARGLSIPLVYNTSGYEDIDTLCLLAGIVDIYMPDIKFGDNATAQKYTQAADYYDIARKALKEMHQQVGDLKVDSRGVAYRGLLVRHLVMPNDLANTGNILEFLAEEISPHTVINLMAQYRPSHKAYEFPELSRRISIGEYTQVIRLARQIGLTKVIGG